MTRMGLYAKFVLLLAGLFLLGTAAVITFIYVSESRRIEQEGLARAETLNQAAFEALYASMSQGGGREGNRAVLERLRQIEGIAELRIIHEPPVDRQFGVEPEEQPQDDLDRRALAGQEVWVIQKVEGHRQVRYVTPLFVRPECQRCHQAQVGEVNGAISVRISLQEHDQALQRRRNILLLSVAGGLLGLGLVTLFALRRMVLQPLQVVQRGAEALARGELGHRLKLSTGDEMEILARAFEEMRANIQRRTWELSVLQRTALAGAEAGNVDQLTARVTQILADELYPETVGVLFLDREGRCLHLHPSYRGIEPDVYRLDIPLGQGVTGTVAQTGEPLLVPDVRAEPRYIEGSPAVRSELCVPVRAGERVVGVINVESAQPDAFSQADLHLLSAVADQVGTALERLRLFQETQRRTAELEALLEITQAVSSSLSLTALLKQIAIRTAQACRANRCTIFLVDQAGERLEPIMSQFADGHADPELWQRFRTTTANRIDVVPFFRQAVHQRRPVVLEDVTRYDQMPRKWTEPFGIQKLLAVPLISRDRVIGLMTLDHEDPTKGFSQEQVDLAMTIASQVAVSIERARLFEAERAARRRAETLQEVAAALGSTLELEELLDRVLEELQKVVPYDSASVQLLRGDHLEIIAGRGFPEPAKVIGLTFPLTGDNPNKDVIARQQPVLVPDAYAAYAAFQEDPHSHIRSWLGVPLLARARVIGMITLDRTEVNAFSEEESDIALAFANHVTVALENARLFGEVERLAVTDGLTGLYNARYFYQALETELERSRRYDHRCSLIMLDLDDFKKYNDRYGHLAGDDLLQELAGLIRREIRETDTAARYGGEEFAVIAPETNGDHGVALAERLRKAVRDHEFVVRETQRLGRITISVGVAGYPKDGEDVETLVEAADMALLRAKEMKDRVCVAADRY